MVDVINVTVVKDKPVTVEAIYIPGPRGPSGTGGGAGITSVEFDIIVAGAQNIAMPSQIGDWMAFYVNGLRQDKTAYSISGSMLQLPSDLIWVGASCLFEYTPA